MPEFGASSTAQLHTCAPPLIEVFKAAIEHIDIKIISGHRSIARQQHLYEIGRSKKKGGDSVHNHTPSDGVDWAPYPIDWNDLPRWYYYAGIIKAIGLSMGIDLRWGGDWDSDMILTDNKFNDLGHFEIRP